MEIDANVVIKLYKDRLSNVENELIINQAQIVLLQEKIDTLKRLLSENDIEINN